MRFQLAALVAIFTIAVVASVLAIWLAAADAAREGSGAVDCMKGRSIGV